MSRRRRALLYGLAAAVASLVAIVLVGAVVFVWIVELMNSAVEAVADAVTLDDHPLIARAKDLGSAAVMLALLFAGAAWLVVLGPRLFGG
mgnify:CR=1 FL=1